MFAALIQLVVKVELIVVARFPTAVVLHTSHAPAANVPVFEHPPQAEASVVTPAACRELDNVAVMKLDHDVAINVPVGPRTGPATTLNPLILSEVEKHINACAFAHPKVAY